MKFFEVCWHVLRQTCMPGRWVLCECESLVYSFLYVCVCVFTFFYILFLVLWVTCLMMTMNRHMKHIMLVMLVSIYHTEAFSFKSQKSDDRWQNVTPKTTVQRESQQLNADKSRQRFLHYETTDVICYEYISDISTTTSIWRCLYKYICIWQLFKS